MTGSNPLWNAHPEWFQSSKPQQPEPRQAAQPKRSGGMNREQIASMMQAIAPILRGYVAEQIAKAINADVPIADQVAAATLPLECEVRELRQRLDAIPPPLDYRGVWAHGTYQRNACCTWEGALWIAVRDTDAKPGEGAEACGWQLAVKRGERGKSSFETAKQVTGFRGSEKEWITSLARPTGTATPRDT
jgi:hypothetical protein